MTENSPALPDYVDVTPKPGRRVRTETGALLPETHVLRGVARSSYWLRLQRDGDVQLAPHQPAPSVESPAGEQSAGDPPAGEGSGGRRKN